VIKELGMPRQKTTRTWIKHAVALLVCCLSVSVAGQTLALTPPMGWNSWDSYGTTVREAQVKANADVMARDLARYGWQYVVVDIQWYEPNAQGHDYKPGAPLVMDDYGRLTPAVNRFPSASNGAGFKALADYIHRQGLKFGIHIMRGIPRQAVEKNTPILNSSHHAAEIADKTNICEWNPDMYGIDVSKPGAQEYYDSIAALYASWGVDFIKADDMSRPYEQRQPEVAALSAAIRKTGRPMLLSLSPGPAPIAQAADLRKNAQMWRISDDFWDDWKLLKQQFNFTRDWAPYIGEDGTWPDADMLPLGKLRVTAKEGNGSPSKFTADEQQTMMTLWCMFRSPLIFGGDLPSSDAATMALISNEEVLAVDQHSLGNHQSLERGNIRAWLAEVPKSPHRYVAVFNLGERNEMVDIKLSDLGIAGNRAEVRDLWLKKEIGLKSGVRVKLRPHASMLYRVSELPPAR
jgi:alpha-galactosidase